MKTIESLEVGDVLKNKKNYDFCTLRQIVKGDEYEQDNYEFFGFLARKRVLNKMFDGAGNKIFTYNDEKN